MGSTWDEMNQYSSKNSTWLEEVGEAVDRSSPPPTSPVPIHEYVARRAYELYLTKGCREGCDLEDWLDAEREILNSESFG